MEGVELVADEASLTEDQGQLFQAVYDRFRADGAWPTFISVDRPLRRQGMDTGAVAQATPQSLLLRPMSGNYRPNPNDLVRLTIRGIAASEGSDDDIDHFVRLLRRGSGARGAGNSSEPGRRPAQPARVQ